MFRESHFGNQRDSKEGSFFSELLSELKENIWKRGDGKVEKELSV